MGLKLDWEIEAEQAQVRNTGEDAESVRQRRRARMRVLLVIVFVLVLFAAAVVGAVLRLRYVDSLVEDNLRNTVEAEVTALRIGDRSAFLSMQRSATEDWLHAQERTFDTYQALKTTRDIQLTGHIRDVVIDGNRARATVDEIVDGVPFTRTWFYWDYEDGWRHVPPDTTFWGEVKSRSGEGVTVRYRALDEPLADALLPQAEGWLADACAILGCAGLPPLTFEIVPSVASDPMWSEVNPWLLQIPSPAAVGTRLDQPFSPSLQQPVARLLAARLVSQTMDNQTPLPVADAAFLRQAVVKWLSDRLAGVQTGSILIDSLAQRYGADTVGRLVRSLQPVDDISMLTMLTGAPSLDQTGLRWDDFLAWRLDLEAELIAQRDEAAFLRLYDTSDEAARNSAYTRFAASPPTGPHDVVAVIPDVDDNGTPLLRARVQVGNEVTLSESEAVFRLVNGSWKRLH